jgi:hypothetical protein
MVLWNYLAQRRDDWWSFVEQEDSHGYGYNSMRYNAVLAITSLSQPSASHRARRSVYWWPPLNSWT